MEELLRRLTAAEKAADEAERAYNEAPESAEAEIAFDKAYDEEFKLYMEAAKEIVKITNGKIDFKTAKVLIDTKRSELETLFA